MDNTTDHCDAACSSDIAAINKPGLLGTSELAEDAEGFVLEAIARKKNIGSIIKVTLVNAYDELSPEGKKILVGEVRRLANLHGLKGEPSCQTHTIY